MLCHTYHWFSLFKFDFARQLVVQIQVAGGLIRGPCRCLQTDSVRGEVRQRRVGRGRLYLGLRLWSWVGAVVGTMLFGYKRRLRYPSSSFQLLLSSFDISLFVIKVYKFSLQRPHQPKNGTFHIQLLSPRHANSKCSNLLPMVFVSLQYLYIMFQQYVIIKVW